MMGKNRVGLCRDSIDDGDFDEEEVWRYEKEDSSPTSRKPRDRSSSAWRIPSAPRMIQRGSNSSSSSSKASHETELTRLSSAPLNIPDWSKIYGKHANNEPSRNDDGMVCEDNGDYGGCGEDGDEDDEDMVPPHEWLARKLARNRISSFSVCEGIGRTLKGRDLSKVRNAVLTKTGFLE